MWSAGVPRIRRQTSWSPTAEWPLPMPRSAAANIIAMVACPKSYWSIVRSPDRRRNGRCDELGWCPKCPCHRGYPVTLPDPSRTRPLRPTCTSHGLPPTDDTVPWCPPPARRLSDPVSPVPSEACLLARPWSIVSFDRLVPSGALISVLSWDVLG